MKTVRVGLLGIAFLFATGCFATADKKSVGYNAGGCAPETFIGAHLEVVDGESITITAASPGPGEVVVLKEPTVYKYTNTDKDGKHYASIKDKSVEIIVAELSDKAILGELTKDANLSAVVFGFAGKEDKLAEDSEKNFKACVDLLHSDDKQSDRAEQ